MKQETRGHSSHKDKKMNEQKSEFLIPNPDVIEAPYVLLIFHFLKQTLLIIPYEIHKRNR